MALPKEYKNYTWQDYLSWPEGERWELIDGVAYEMSHGAWASSKRSARPAPAPSRIHQQILGEMFRQFANFLIEAECKVFVAPFDVKLSIEEDNDNAPTVVQPDLVLCCDPEKFTEQGMNGAPDLVVEIVSPSTGFRDRKDKFNIYDRYGVGEYWIIDPEERVLEIYCHSGEKLERFEVYGPDDFPVTAALPGFTVDLARVFKKDGG